MPGWLYSGRERLVVDYGTRAAPHLRAKPFMNDHEAYQFTETYDPDGLEHGWEIVKIDEDGWFTILTAEDMKDAD